LILTHNSNRMKQSEIKELSLTDLNEKLGALQKNYTDLKMAHAITPLENPLQLRGLRRTVARIATELTKRELQ
jgi:large subunit ribosomal protein L29